MTTRQDEDVKMAESSIWDQRDEHFCPAIPLLLAGRTEESHQEKHWSADHRDVVHCALIAQPSGTTSFT